VWPDQEFAAAEGKVVKFVTANARLWHPLRRFPPMKTNMAHCEERRSLRTAARRSRPGRPSEALGMTRGGTLIPRRRKAAALIP